MLCAIFSSTSKHSCAENADILAENTLPFLPTLPLPRPLPRVPLKMAHDDWRESHHAIHIRNAKAAKISQAVFKHLQYRVGERFSSSYVKVSRFIHRLLRQLASYALVYSISGNLTSFQWLPGDYPSADIDCKARGEETLCARTKGLCKTITDGFL